MPYSNVDLDKYRTEEVENIWSVRGIFSDGRPFLAEYWVEDRIYMMTFYFSPIDFEIDKEYEKGKSFEKSIYQDVLDYLRNENESNRLLVKNVDDLCDKHISVWCFGSDNDRIISVNVFCFYDDF
jgi:hypothetical protein